MLAAVVCSRLCRFRGIRPYVRWLKRPGTERWHLLGFRRRRPVRQTSANVLAERDAELLESLLLEFVEPLDLPECADATIASLSSPAAVAPSPTLAPPEVESWDGKTLRGTRHGEQRAEQVLIRMQHALAKVLSSTAIPANTNESKVAYDLVRRLLLTGKLIVGDAADCQRDICEAVMEQDGDDLVTVKGNQPQLLRDIEQAFVIPEGFSPLRRA